MRKMTIYLHEEDYRRLHELAHRKRRSNAALVREAVMEYLAAHAHPQPPRSLGAFRSRLSDLGSRADMYLAGLGESK